MNFSKPALTLPQQLHRWQARGLAVPEAARALHFLRFIGYYRLSAYALPFQQTGAVAVAGQPDKPFKPGTTFDEPLVGCLEAVRLLPVRGCEELCGVPSKDAFSKQSRIEVRFVERNASVAQLLSCDGHNVADVTRAFEEATKSDRPVLVA